MRGILAKRHLWYEAPALETLGLEVPGDVSDLVRRAMAKAPAERPSMRELADGLAGALRRLRAPRRAVAGGLALPNKHEALAPTEPAMSAFGQWGTVRMGAVGARVAGGGGSERGGGAGAGGGEWAGR